MHTTPRHFDVNRVPLVAIDGATLRIRRYVGRECTHQADLIGFTSEDRVAAVTLVDLFRTDPARAMRQSHDTTPILEDQSA